MTRWARGRKGLRRKTVRDQTPLRDQHAFRPSAFTIGFTIPPGTSALVVPTSSFGPNDAARDHSISSTRPRGGSLVRYALPFAFSPCDGSIPPVEPQAFPSFARATFDGITACCLFRERRAGILVGMGKYQRQPLVTVRLPRMLR